MANEELRLKIRTLVEGLRDVERLADAQGDVNRQAGRQVPDNTRRYRRGVREATQRSEQFRRVAGQLRTAVAGIGFGLAAARLGRFTREQLESAEALQQTADRLGLGTEKLQEYRFAAEQVRVDQNTLELGLQRFNRRVGEAAAGTGELKQVLDDYDISVRDSNGNIRAQDEILADLADRVANAESAQQQLRIAFKAFDSEGAALVNLLRQGSDGMARLGREARQTGRVIDRELIADAAALNNELSNFFGELQTALREGFLREFVGEADELRELMDDEQFKQNIRNIGELLATLATALGAVAKATLDAGQILGEAFAREGGAAAGIKDIREEIEEIDRILRERREGSFLGNLLSGNLGINVGTDEELRARRRELEEQLAMLQSLRGFRVDTAVGFGDVPLAAGGGGGGGGGDGGGGRDLLAARVGDFEALPSVLDVTRQLEESLERDAEAADRLGSTIGDFEMPPTVLDVTRELEENLRRDAEQMDEMSQFAIEAARNMQRGFSDFFFDPFEQGLEGLEQAFLRTIQRMIADALAADLLNAMFGEASGTEGGQTAQLFQGLFSLFSTAHAGGVVGRTAFPQRAASPLAWAGAPRMHVGGIAGDEVPIVARRGEEILPASSPRHIANAGAAPQVNMRNVNVIREQDIADAMAGPAGEQVVLNIIGRNPDSVRGALGN